MAGSLTANQRTSKSAIQQAATGPISETGNQVSKKSGSLGHESPSAELLVLLLVIVLGSFAYTLPQYTPVEAWRQQPQAVIRWDRFSPAERVGMVAATVEQPATGPMEAQYLAGEPLQVATVLAGTGTVETLRHGGALDEIQVQADGPVTVQFYTYDYPGWQVTIDGQHTAHRAEPPYGLITVEVPGGEHHVSLRMGSTPPRFVGGLISLLAVLAIGVGLFGEGIRRRLSRWG